jgi:hypothetical protein
MAEGLVEVDGKQSLGIAARLIAQPGEPFKDLA